MTWVRPRYETTWHIVSPDDPGLTRCGEKVFGVDEKRSTPPIDYDNICDKCLD